MPEMEILVSTALLSVGNPEQIAIAPSGGRTDTRDVKEVINILFMIDELVEMGGAERAFMRLIRDLPSRFRATAITFRANLSPHLRATFPCPLEVIPLGRTYDMNALRVGRRLRNYIRQHNINMVHTFFETSDLWGGLIVKSVPGVIHISSRRDMGILRSTKHRIAYRYLGCMAKRIVTVSDRVRTWCIEADRLPANRVTTVYNGVDDLLPTTLSRATARQKLGLADNTHTLVVTTVGHVRKVKGFDLLIRAAAQVVLSFPDIIFLFVGDVHEPDHLVELEQLVTSLSLQDHIRFCGPTEEVASILIASDVFVLPSRSEGMSNALIEAMMCALPCVATDVGGNREAIANDVNGYLIASESVDAVAHALSVLLRDPELRRRMGTEGRRIFLNRFNQASMINGMVEVYERALGERQ